MERLGRILLPLATLGCLAFGVAGALRVVGWQHLAAPAGELRPIAFDDYALQFYYGQLGSRLLAEGGVTWGYDPSFMAGYPKTPIYYPSSKPYEFAMFLLSGLDPARAFNLVTFVMLALLPFLMYGACVGFGFPPSARLAVVAMSTLPHLMVPAAGFFGLMEAAGMVPYIFASFLSVFVVSLVYGFLVVGRNWAGGLLLVAAPLLFLCHPTAALLSGLPIAVLYLTRLRATTMRRHAWMWLVLAVTLVFNWRWIEGSLLYAHYADLGEFYTPGGRSHFALRGGLLAPFRVYVPHPWPVSLLPPVLGGVGLALWWRRRELGLLRVVAPQLLLLFAIAFYGASLGLSALNPARITLPLALYLFLPAGWAAPVILQRARSRARQLGPARARGLGLAAAAALLLALVWGGMSGRIWRPYSLPALEAREGFSEKGMALLDWIRERTDASGRLLHEETDRSSHQYYGAHMAAWIPLYSGRELAGGPAPYALLQHNTLRFIAGTFQGRRLESVAPEELLDWLVLYNVRWVLCWKPATRRYFDGLRFSSRVGEFDKFTLYRIERPPSYFLQGRGELRREGDRILLRDLVPEDGVVAIKYHWLESLRSEPPTTLEPLYRLDDPVPFISLRDPPRELTIFNDFDYGLGRP